MDISGFAHLNVGGRYKVRQAFTDFDGGLHPVGEVWLFRGSSFLPYDNGLSLFIASEQADGTWRDVQIRMRWTPEDQGPIVDTLSDYVEPDELSAA